MAGRMRTSRAGLDLIKSFEGFHPRATVIEEGGPWLIGYGHTAGAREGLKVSEDDAEAILRDYDLKPIETALNDRLLAPVSQNEFDALVSFVLNIGLDAFFGSEVFALVNTGAKLRAAEAMAAWRKARIGGRMIVVDALVRRRAAERALFLEPDNGRTPATSALITPQLDLGAAILRPREPARTVDTSSGRAIVVSEEPTSRDSETERPEQTSPTTAPRESTPEAAARAVTERLSRILGEQPGLAEVKQSDGPSVDEITAAVSALAEPEETNLEPVELQDGTPPRRKAVNETHDAFDLPPAEPQTRSTKPVVDDLETVSVDPDAAIGNAGSGVERPNWPSVILFAMAAFCGALIAAWGVSHVTDLLSTNDPVTRDWDLYAGPFTMLLGGLIFIVMLYYLARALFTDTA